MDRIAGGLSPARRALVLALALVTSACHSATSPPAPSTSVAAAGPACGWAVTPPPTYRHVVWIWMENHTRSQVLGDPRAAPYETALAGQCGSASNYSSVGSPSLPNYLGATSGGTQGVTDDAAPAAHRLTVDNVFRQVRASGGTERSYQEDMPGPCAVTSTGGYAVKHNPAAYYAGPGDQAACRADDLPFIAFQHDLQADRLPTFAFVTPNLCHDTHDCSVATGDAWLAATLPGVLAGPGYRSGRTAVMVIWDEPTPTPNLIIGPSIRPGSVVSLQVDHYALLRTTEEMLGLPTGLGAATSAPSLRGPFNL